MSPAVLEVFAGLFVALLLASAVGWWLGRSRPSAAVTNLNARVRAWWVMIAAGGAALALGRWAVVILFAALAWGALAEFAPRGWFFAAVPLQFLAVALEWNWCAAWLIPLWCLLLRRAEERLGLLLCVYGLSAIPALGRPEWMLYLVLVVQASDVLQYLWGRALGRHQIAPRISPAKTVEGLVGGVATATALGAMLHHLTPFSPAAAAGTALAITSAGFGSGLLFSALKRRRGIKDWGTAIAGHGGVLDRVDSLCLSAPLFLLALRLAV
jgi:phosphatidate cytidylyltransferase